MQDEEDDINDEDSTTDDKEMDPQILQVGRAAAHGRSMVAVNIPVDMMKEAAPGNEDRPHCT